MARKKAEANKEAPKKVGRPRKAPAPEAAPAPAKRERQPVKKKAPSRKITPKVTSLRLVLDLGETDFQNLKEAMFGLIKSGRLESNATLEDAALSLIRQALGDALYQGSEEVEEPKTEAVSEDDCEDEDFQNAMQAFLGERCFC